MTVGTGVYFPGISFGHALTYNGVTYSNTAPYNLNTATTAKDIWRRQWEGGHAKIDPKGGGSGRFQRFWQSQRSA